MKTVSIEERKAERLIEWQGWLSEFLKDRETTVTTIPHAAELLNDYYWRLALHFLKPLLQQSADDNDHYLHFYKIVSASELTVMFVLPLAFVVAHPKEEVRELNAEFAWFVAVSILLNWKIDSAYVFDEETVLSVAEFQELIDINSDGTPKLYNLNFRDEHIMWLKQFNPLSSPPILSNSQTWRLFYIACHNLNSSNKS